MATKRSSSRRPKGAARPAKRATPAAPDDATRYQQASGGPAPARAAGALRVVRCPDESLVGRAFAVGAADLTLGRDHSCTISLPDADVSRQHARIVRTGNSHVLVDMESTNGTRVNGELVSEVTLRDGDELSLGGTVLVYQA